MWQKITRELREWMGTVGGRNLAVRFHFRPAKARQPGGRGQTRGGASQGRPWEYSLTRKSKHKQIALPVHITTITDDLLPSRRARLSAGDDYHSSSRKDEDSTGEHRGLYSPTPSKPRCVRCEE